MNRRQFMRRATAAAVGALTLDPDLLLWVPGRKTIFDMGAGLAAEMPQVWTTIATYPFWRNLEHQGVDGPTLDWALGIIEQRIQQQTALRRAQYGYICIDSSGAPPEQKLRMRSVEHLGTIVSSD